MSFKLRTGVICVLCNRHTNIRRDEAHREQWELRLCNRCFNREFPRHHSRDPRLDSLGFPTSIDADDFSEESGPNDIYEGG